MNGNVRWATVALDADTPIEVIEGAKYSSPAEAGKPGLDRVQIGDMTLWPCYAAGSDADVILACQRLIDALGELQGMARARLAAEASATLAADPGILFAGTVGEFLDVTEGAS
jgi:hypothetical protein